MAPIIFIMPISFVITQAELDMVSQQGDCPSVTPTLYELELDNQISDS